MDAVNTNLQFSANKLFKWKYLIFFYLAAAFSNTTAEKVQNIFEKNL